VANASSHTFFIVDSLPDIVLWCSLGSGPPTENNSCSRINGTWIPLDATFFRVTPTTTVKEIQDFAAAQIVPDGTEAVGLFSGGCTLDTDPFGPSALIVNYCGTASDVPLPPVPLPPVQPPETAAPVGALPAAAVVAEDLEAETAKVLATALGF
jgi:hypothetical protein